MAEALFTLKNDRGQETKAWEKWAPEQQGLHWDSQIWVGTRKGREQSICLQSPNHPGASLSSSAAI